MKKWLCALLLVMLVFLLGSAAAELSTNLRIQTETDPDNRFIVTQTYLDKDGCPAVADDKGCAAIRYTYKETNLPGRTEYLDAEGNLTNNIDGYAVLVNIYSGKRLLETDYLDADGNPVNGPEGYARQEINYHLGRHLTTWEYDTEGNPVNLHRISEFNNKEYPGTMTRDGWYDADGNPAVGPDGYAWAEFEYKRTKLRKAAYYGLDGELAVNTAEGYAMVEYTFRGMGISGVSYYGADGELTAGPDGYARTVYSFVDGRTDTQRQMFYNADGSPFFTAKGYCGIQRTRTGRGRVTDESYFAGENERGYSTDGYSRVTKEYTFYGKVGVQTFYDAEDNRMVPKKTDTREQKIPMTAADWSGQNTTTRITSPWPARKAYTRSGTSIGTSGWRKRCSLTRTGKP